MKTITIEVPDSLGGAVAKSDDDLPHALATRRCHPLVQPGVDLPGQGHELTGLTQPVGAPRSAW